jgi:hypothetical protein
MRMFPDEIDQDAERSYAREEDRNAGNPLLRDYIALRAKNMNHDQLWKIIDFIRGLEK